MARDSSLYFRKASAGDLTATSDNTVIDLGESRQVPLRGMVVRVDVPAIAAGADTLVVNVQESDDGSTYTTFLTFPTITGTSAAPRAYKRRVHSDKRYLRCRMVVTGAAPNFGAVTAVLVNADHFGD